MAFFRNWYYMYLNSTRSEEAFETKIALIGKPYRVQYPFPSMGRIADFALHREKLIIEVDGASHSQLAQRRKDLTTTIKFEKAGWRVIRFTNAEALDGPVTWDVIEHKLRHRPTLAELEAALLELPAPPEKPAKPRGRRRAPGPKKARKPRKSPKGNSSVDNTE